MEHPQRFHPPGEKSRDGMIVPENKKGRAFRLFLLLLGVDQYLRLRAASAFFLRFTLGFS